METELEFEPVYDAGDLVLWMDPEDGAASGWYTVAEDNGESVTLRDERGDISNEGFHHELIYVTDLTANEYQRLCAVTDGKPSDELLLVVRQLLTARLVDEDV